MFLRNFAARTGAAVLSLLFFPSVILPASAQKSFLVAQETAESACQRGWNEQIATIWSVEGYARGCDRAYFYYTRWLQTTGAQPQQGEDLFKTFLEITGQVITAPVTIALETGAQSGQSYTIQQVGKKMASRFIDMSFSSMKTIVIMSLQRYTHSI